jgi:hypothetical protein
MSHIACVYYRSVKPRSGPSILEIDQYNGIEERGPRASSTEEASISDFEISIAGGTEICVNLKSADLVPLVTFTERGCTEWSIPVDSVVLIVGTVENIKGRFRIRKSVLRWFPVIVLSSGNEEDLYRAWTRSMQLWILTGITLGALSVTGLHRAALK